MIVPVHPVAVKSNSPCGNSTLAGGATGGSNFRSASGGFQFNWDTTTAQATGKGCYTLVWQLKDRSGPAPAYDVLDPSLLPKASVQLK